MKILDIFLIFALKHRLLVLIEAVLTSTHSRCFRAKIRNDFIIMIYKSGVKGCLHYTDMFA